MNDLASGWLRATVGEIADSVQSGFASGDHNRDGKGIPHLRPMNVGRDGRLSLDDLRFVEDTDGHRLRRGDILFNNTNSAELVGKTTWIDNDQELAFSNHMTRVRVPEGISPEFIARQLHHLWTRGAFKLLCNNHVSQASVSGRTLAGEVELAIPPAAEQKRIVAKIEELTARSRRAKEALEAVPPLLDQLRQSILAAAFRGDLTADWRAKNPAVEPADTLIARIRAERRARWEAAELARMTAKGKRPTDERWRERYVEPSSEGGDDLGDLPPSWTWSSVGELFYVGVGATPSRGEPRYWGGHVPWVSSGEVAFCRISSTRERITHAGLENTSTELHPAGTVLIGMIGEGKTRGQVAILDIPACNSQNSAAIRVSETPLSPEYVYQYLTLAYERTRRVGSGNNQQALNKSRVQALSIPVAPLDEQRELLRRLEKWLERADAVEAAAMEAAERVAVLDQATLAKAFRGELVPQDPDDEPASVLLERIRAAREASESAGQASRRRSRPANGAAGSPELVRARDGDGAGEPSGRSAPARAAGKALGDLADLDDETLHREVFAALWTRGPLDKDDATRLVAEHLRDAGHVEFQRLRSDGLLYAQILDAIEAAVKAGALDRPRRGQVRACKADAADYSGDDWRHALVASLGEEPVDREDAIRAAAEWARDHLGLEFSRLREDGHIVTGLRSALNSAIRRGEVAREDARRICRGRGGGAGGKSSERRAMRG